MKSGPDLETLYSRNLQMAVVCGEGERKKAVRRRRLGLVGIAGYSFSVCLIVLTVFARVRLTVVERETNQLRQHIAELEDRRARLEIEKERAMSFDELETYAREALGMKDSAGSVIYIDVSKNAAAENQN